MSRRQVLAKARISIFEKIYELKFVNYYSLTIECSNEKGKAKKKKKIGEAEAEVGKKKVKGRRIE